MADTSSAIDALESRIYAAQAYENRAFVAYVAILRLARSIALRQHQYGCDENATCRREACSRFDPKRVAPRRCHISGTLAATCGFIRS